MYSLIENQITRTHERENKNKKEQKNNYPKNFTDTTL
jgi:hypothetical protein